MIGAMIGRELNSVERLPLWEKVIVNTIIGLVTVYWGVWFVRGGRKKLNIKGEERKDS